MNFKTLEEKINFLNKITGETLCIAHYSNWCLSSYGENTLFLYNGYAGNIRAKSFSECVDKAYQCSCEEDF
jgi:hypothetical protein